MGLQYLATWLAGNGCVPIYNLMEDAATAEICRAQVWQWTRHGAAMDDGRVVTPALVSSMMQRTMEKLSGRLPDTQLALAARLYDEMINSPDFAEFLTLRAYEYLD